MFSPCYFSFSLSEPVLFIVTLAFNSNQVYEPANVSANLETQLQELPSLVMEQTGIEDPLALNTIVRYGNLHSWNGINKVYDYAVHMQLCLYEPLEGCLAEETSINSSNGAFVLTEPLRWPETDISQTAVVSCPCGESGVNAKATRRCWGTFQATAYWEEAQVSQCNINLTATTINLCNLFSVSNVIENILFAQNTSCLVRILPVLAANIITNHME